jgi:hypothetical protein
MSHPRPKAQTELVIVIDDDHTIPQEVIEAAQRLPLLTSANCDDLAVRVAFDLPKNEAGHVPFYRRFQNRRGSTRNK